MQEDRSKSKATKDYYYQLGVRPDSTSEEIQEAYNELYEIRSGHVNVQGQDPDAMLKAYKDICEAYEILMDPNKRREYDREQKIRGKVSLICARYGPNMQPGRPLRTKRHGSGSGRGSDIKGSSEGLPEIDPHQRSQTMQRLFRSETGEPNGVPYLSGTGLLQYRTQ